VEPSTLHGQRWIAIFMAISCLACSLVLVIHTLLPQFIAKSRAKNTRYIEQEVASESDEQQSHDLTQQSPAGSSKSDRIRPGHRRSSVPMAFPSTAGPQVPQKLEKDISESPSLRMTDEKLAYWQQAGSGRIIDTSWSASPTALGSPFNSTFDSPMNSRTATMVTSTKHHDLKLGDTASRLDSIDKLGSRATTMVNSMHNILDKEYITRQNDKKPLGIISIERGIQDKKGKGKEMEAIVSEKSALPFQAKQRGSSAPVLHTKQRVDYLAGLTAICAVIVSVDHFFSTFSPAIMFPAAPYHYKAEIWINRYVAPYLMNQIWIGVFFTCSTRFLVTKYLREGKLVLIAEKAVTRNFRGK
jgi:hypothetical protein